MLGMYHENPFEVLGVFVLLWYGVPQNNDNYCSGIRHLDYLDHMI